MDPDATLATVLDAAREIADHHSTHPDDAMRLADAVLALHGWIDRGGYLPAAWRATAGGHFYGMSGAEVGGE